MAKPRPSVRALIVRDGTVLVTVNSDRTPLFYLLPGGGQQFGESMREAVLRECREELGVVVEVGDVAFVRDYRGAEHEFALWDAHYHQIEIAFWCSLPGGAEPTPSTADTYQTGITWLPLGELDEAPLYPAALKDWLVVEPQFRTIYLGDVN